MSKSIEIAVRPDAEGCFVAMFIIEILIIGWVLWLARGGSVACGAGLGLFFAVLYAARSELMAGIMSVLMGFVWVYCATCVGFGGWWLLGLAIAGVASHMFALRWLSGDWASMKFS